MKLLTIVSDSICGGATISILNLLKGLRENGVDILVITPNQGYLCKELDRISIKYDVIKYGFSTIPPWSTWRNKIAFIPRLCKFFLRDAIAYRRLCKVVRKERPDIIHTNVSVIDLGFRLAQRFHLPHIWHVREYGDLDFELHRFPNKQKFIEKISKHSYSIAITKDLSQYLRLKEPLSRVIYNGILSRNEVTCQPEKENYFLYVGRVTDKKGATDVIRAFREFCQSNDSMKLLLLGSCEQSYKDELTGILKGSPSESLVQFMGHVDNVNDYMQKAKALIVPSYYEGFGRITAEAMFNGCLVIGRNTAGTKEQLDNGLSLTGKEIGYRFNSVDELVQAMRKVFSLNIDDYTDMAMRAQTVVKELYSTEANVENSIAFIKEVMEKENNGPCI